MTKEILLSKLTLANSTQHNGNIIGEVVEVKDDIKEETSIVLEEETDDTVSKERKGIYFRVVKIDESKDLPEVFKIKVNVGDIVRVSYVTPTEYAGEGYARFKQGDIINSWSL